MTDAAAALAARARLVARLARRASPGAVGAITVLLVVAGLAPTANAWAFRSLLDHLITRPIDQRSALLWAAAVGAAALLSTVVPYLRAPLDARLQRRLTLVGQDEVYAALSRAQGLRYFESPGFLDSLRLARQASQISVYGALNAFFALGQAMVIVVGFAAALWSVDPVLVFVTVGTAVPGIAAQFGLTGKRVALARRNNPLQRRQSFYFGLLSSAQAAKEIRLFGLGGFFHGLVRHDLVAMHADEARLSRRVMYTQGSLALLTAAASAGSIGWVVHLAASGRITLGDVALYIAALSGLQNGSSALVGRTSDVFENLTLVADFAELLRLEPDVPLEPNPRPTPALSSGIEFHDVWFRYTESSPWVLRGLNLRIDAGTSTALVGLNGAGKSTIVKLLCRFYDPVEGTVTWDGTDIRLLDPEQLRARIGAVFQDFMKYELTAAQNIGLGDVARIGERGEIEAAAKLAGVEGFVSRLPAGLDTMLGRTFAAAPGGGSEADVSGGQWQRIALARSLMRADRDLLVLDEAGSGMDAEAEEETNAVLAEVRRGRTSMLISHRLSTIRGADVVHVLADGAVAETGTHDALMARDGTYRRLFLIQARGYRDDAGPGDTPDRHAISDGRVVRNGRAAG